MGCIVLSIAPPGGNIFDSFDAFFIYIKYIYIKKGGVILGGRRRRRRSVKSIQKVQEKCYQVVVVERTMHPIHTKKSFF
jgi:hypothetical protein